MFTVSHDIRMNGNYRLYYVCAVHFFYFIFLFGSTQLLATLVMHESLRGQKANPHFKNHKTLTV